MAAEHVIGDVIKHLGPIDDSPHGLLRRFPSSVVALIVERSRDVRGHGLWDPKQLVGVGPKCRPGGGGVPHAALTAGESDVWQ